MEIRKPKIGLFAGGIECYWVDMSMDELPARLQQDVDRLIASLDGEVIFPCLAGNPAQSAGAGQAIREAQCDIAVIYHATFIADDMTVAFLDALGEQIPVLQLHSQGLKGIPDDFSLIDYGTCYGNNSAIQAITTLRRLGRDLKLPVVVGELDDPAFQAQINGWCRAARAVNALKGANVSFLPHWVTSFALWDTVPDPLTMYRQTGVKIEFRYVSEVKERMDAVPDTAVSALVKEIYSSYEVLEPPREEVERAARHALALEQLCNDFEIDALACEPFDQLAKVTGCMPAYELGRLADLGVVVTIEGDLQVAVAGLMLKALTGRTGQFFEHLMFDVEKNWILGGHDGGSTPFYMAHPDQPIKMRNTMYVDFKKTDFAFDYGVVPEFIVKPGPITMLNLCQIRENENRHAMRIVTGDAVDTHARPIHMEHTIFQPHMPVTQYYSRLAELTVDHHFVLIHGELEDDLIKMAKIMDMEVDYVCSRD